MSKKLDGIKIGTTIATERGGELLSTVYVNTHANMSWRCKEGHEWYAELNDVKRGNWCRICSLKSVSNRTKMNNGIEVARNIAISRGGRCTSDHYTNNATHMNWICSESHKWSARLVHIKDSKSWCPKCASSKRALDLKLSDGIEQAQSMASDMNGLCLSKKYVNIKTKLKWRCAAGHEWKASLGLIKQGSWCLPCSIKTNGDRRRAKDGIEQAHILAKNNGGTCLSDKYITGRSKLKWKCYKNHTWSASLASVKSDKTWCPSCSILKAARSRNNTEIITHWKTGEELVCTASYEAAVVNYLNKSKINFKWQPRSFTMPDGRKYHPDMYIYSTKTWIEIKGYFWGKSEEKWNWFHTIKANSELWNTKKLKQMGII